MFTFQDIISTIEVNSSLSLTYSSIRIIEELTEKNPDYHKTLQYVNFVLRNSTKRLILTMKPFDEVKNIEIRMHLEIFSRLTSYSRNPIEPLLIMLISNEKYKSLMTECVTELCRGNYDRVRDTLEVIINKEEQWTETQNI